MVTCKGGAYQKPVMDCTCTAISKQLFCVTVVTFAIATEKWWKGVSIISHAGHSKLNHQGIDDSAIISLIEIAA